MNIWVYIDHFKGQALPASWEALGAGLALGKVTALVFGAEVEQLAKQACEFGAEEVLQAEDKALGDFRAEDFASTLSALASQHNPDLIFLPTTTRGRELAAMSAIDLDTGVLVDVIAIEMEGDRVVATRPIYAGKLLEKTLCAANPQIVTLRGRAFPKPVLQSGRTGTITKVETLSRAATTIEGYSETESGINLSDATVIVSGGRGVSNNPNLIPPNDLGDEEAEIWRAQQGFNLVGELAATLGGAVGASRAAVDANYVPYAHQVGQTGKVVSPDLYIAAGISGAIQHLAGMRNSKLIVAINKDPDAPIFNAARYGVVGDLFQILPALTETFKKKLGK